MLPNDYYPLVGGNELTSLIAQNWQVLGDGTSPGHGVGATAMRAAARENSMFLKPPNSHNKKCFKNPKF